MVIKFYKGYEVHMFDEIDSLKYLELIEEPETISSDTLDYLDIQKPTVSKNYSVWFMNKNQTEATHILATSPIYLMNNNGKTIEVL